MQLLRYPGPATVYTASPPLVSRADSQPSALQRIRTRGVIRVGYRNDFLPFSYTNAAGDLVGFDVEMAHTLARDLHVALEFVPVELDTMAAQLNAGACDIAGVYEGKEAIMDFKQSNKYKKREWISGC